MVILSADGAHALANYQLVNTADGRILMTRQLRVSDAEQFNLNWQARGITARWVPIPIAATASSATGE